MMSPPDTDQVRQATKDLVRAARKENSTNTWKLLSFNIVRDKLEAQFSVKKGFLDNQPFKDIIKEVVKEVVDREMTSGEGDSVDEDEDEDAMSTSDTPPVPLAEEEQVIAESLSEAAEAQASRVFKETKTKSRSSVKKTFKSRSVISSSEDEDEPELAPVAAPAHCAPNMQTSPTKLPTKSKPKAQQSDTTKTVAKPKKADRKKSRVVEIVESEHHDEPSSPNASARKQPSTTKVSLPKKAREEGQDEEVEASESERNSKKRSRKDKEPSGSKKQPRPSAQKPPPAKASSPKKEEGRSEEADESESERSVIFDEPPKKRSRKGKEPTKSQKQPKETKQKRGAVANPKDEASITRLKAVVRACGVRKIWTKEFTGIEKPSQQIKKIKEILAGLGMEGRPSLERAKEIKAKRELAKELEDVCAFEEAHTGKSGRSSRSQQQSTAPASGGEESEDESDQDSITQEIPQRKKKTARQSILNFLGDQSDEE